ncbi:MAG: nitroreductase family protein [Kofleriaceae bacterium]|nr:nitroreductase family protein [Kofleriaceae bacterium]
MAADPWEIQARDYPMLGSAREQLQFLLGYAILAPSTHNTQPWQFALRDDGIDVYVDDSKVLPIIDPVGRQRIMSVGAAVLNIRVAARAVGLKIEETFFPHIKRQPTLVAQLRLAGRRRPSALDVALRDNIVTRRTNRQPYTQRPVSYAIADDLIEVVRNEGAWLLRLHPRAKGPLADIITAADRAQFADKGFRKELSKWLVPSGSGRRDGIPFAKKEYGSRMPIGVAMMVRTFDIGDNVAAKETSLAKGSPMLVVLGTPNDTPHDWVAAGRAMQAMMLKAGTYGLAASYLNQALEIPELREQVFTLVEGRPNPQLVMRFGYGPAVQHPTPRHSVKSTLL